MAVSLIIQPAVCRCFAVIPAQMSQMASHRGWWSRTSLGCSQFLASSLLKTLFTTIGIPWSHNGRRVNPPVLVSYINFGAHTSTTLTHLSFSLLSSHLESYCPVLDTAYVLCFNSFTMNRLKPTKYTARYPRWMVGKPLLIASSALASLGDAMFGYSQGIMASNAVQPGFLKTIFGADVTLEDIRASNTGIDPWVFGASLSTTYLCP